MKQENKNNTIMVIIFSLNSFYLVVLVLIYLLFKDRASLENEFNKIDVDHDGFITISEFKTIIKSKKENITEDEIAAIFYEIDVDGSGNITIDGK
jgi:Ca2+-binding EF-hand superfamily protein